MSTNIDTLVWLDIETDGLDPKGNLLQVACILTDLQGNEVAEPFERVVAYDAETAALIRLGASDFVRDMHDTTGLWDRLSSADAKPLAEVERDTLDYIKSHAPEARQGQFAGNSVRFDMNWAEVHLPDVYAHLHYRNIDITAVWTTMERFGLVSGDGPEFIGEKHNAVDDIRHAVNCYRWLKEQTR